MATPFGEEAALRRHHLAVALLGSVAACARDGATEFWRPGETYSLVLVADGPRSQNAAALPPGRELTDTARMRLRVDSVVSGLAYGSADGETVAFGVPFHAVGGDRFVATRRGERWAVSLNPQATDTGLELGGAESDGRLRGSWTPRFPSTARGTFYIEPAI